MKNMNNIEKYNIWLKNASDETVRAQLASMQGDADAINDAFYRDLEFGTGGFASMVLLSGLTVNAGIYIVCEYRNLLAAHPAVSPIRTYVRAYSHKIIAVFLTILSTVLGLVPFFIDGAKDSFWFSFAVGTIAGLLFSIIALVFYLPVFALRRPK